MIVWLAEKKELEKLYSSLKGQFPDLDYELEHLIRTEDENVAMLYSRRCLEIMITDLCECELKRPRKTEPLKGIIDKLLSEEKVPSHIITSMHSLNSLSIYGAHPKDFEPEQVKPVLNNLVIIIKWYQKYKEDHFLDIQQSEDRSPEYRKQSDKFIKEELKELSGKPTKFIRRKEYIIAVIAVVLIGIGLFAYSKIFKRETLEKLKLSGEKISVAIMPFQNLTNDTTWNVWQLGLQNELITTLTSSEEIKVRQFETVNTVLQSKGFTNYASITPSVASNISQKVLANVFIYGSIKQLGTIIRVNAQLMDSKTKEVFKSFQIDGTPDKLLEIVDSLAVMVKNSLIISKLTKELPFYLQTIPSTTSSEAYRYYLYGEDARRKRNFPTARKMFLQAVAIDSNFTLIYLKLSVACMNQGLYEESREWGLKAYAKRDQVSLKLKILINKNHAFFFETPYEEVKCLRQLLEIDDVFPGTYYDIGLAYLGLYQYDKAIPEFEKALEIYDKMDSKPWWVYNYSLLGESYHKTGQYKKEKKLYKKADKDFPNDPLIIYQNALLSLTQGDTVAAHKYLDKYIFLSRENYSEEEFVTIGPAQFYIEEGKLDKAEEYLRQEYNSKPDNAYRIYDLAWFLIDKDRGIDEGLKLIDRALELRPDLHWSLLDGKGWALYKQGKYEEALSVLEECWNNRVYYQHTIYQHLQEAIKAVANQRNI